MTPPNNPNIKYPNRNYQLYLVITHFVVYIQYAQTNYIMLFTVSDSTGWFQINEWALKGEKFGPDNRRVLPLCMVELIRKMYSS